jgi:DNA mismatch repair protein MSH5
MTTVPSVLFASYMRLIYLDFIADQADGTYQIRPFKEFVAAKGRDRFLSLEYFSSIATVPDNENQPGTSEDTSNISRHTTVYDFMRSRREATGGDPTIRRWNASVRLANFASVETSPLCVCVNPSLFLFAKMYAHRWPQWEHLLIIWSGSAP